MKFKSLKAVLISSLLILGSQFVVAEKSLEKIPETKEMKEARIESQLNFMFKEALTAAAAELKKNQKVYPFAFVVKRDGSVGYFSATEKSKDLGVNEQAARVRRMLKDMAISGQIDASTFVMYAGVTQNGIKEQGLMFEIEHREGLSLLRFLPVADSRGESGGELVLATNRIQNTTKKRDIFVDSIVK